MIQTQLTASPAGAILSLLQRLERATVKEMEASLGVTTTAVRQQLTSLMAQGYIKQALDRSGRGRPKHIYSLTPEGRKLFPQHYDEFTNSLLREMLVSDGAQKVQLLLERMGARLAQQYADQIASSAPAERAQKLAELLNAKGILAEVKLEGERITVHEYTCPYYELARQHRGICDMEQGMMAHIIELPVELVQCSLDGHHGCQFQVGP